MLADLDRFLPVFDIQERHQIAVRAPAPLTMATISKIDWDEIWLVRTIIRTREMLLGASPDSRPLPRGFLAKVKALGWGMLVDRPGQEILMGAFTQPWEPNVVFQGLPETDFVAFAQPGYVKIVWGIAAEPTTEGCLLLTETRAVATDEESRRKFASYWRRFSPGVRLIRRALLRAAKKRAEQNAHGYHC